MVRGTPHELSEKGEKVDAIGQTIIFRPTITKYPSLRIVTLRGGTRVLSIVVAIY